MNRADQPMSSRDVEEAARLFLARMPDAALLARWVNAPFGAVLGDWLQSPEFQSGVLQPLLLRESLPQERLGEPALRVLDWVQRRLPLTAANAAKVGAASGWVPLLEVLLADPNLMALCPDLLKAGIDRLFRERIERAPTGKILRRVLGAIDAASTLEIRGWAFDLCDRESPVTLEFYADNFFIGAASCTDSRPDVQEAAGGSGRCGFTFRIPAERRAIFAGGRALVAIDALSRERVGVSTVVGADLTHALDMLSVTRSEVSQLRAILERIEARLPDLGRLASVPLEAYAEYWQRFYAPADDAGAAPQARTASLGFRPLISVVMPTWNASLSLLESAIESVCRQTYPNWELLIVDDASDSQAAVQALVDRYRDDERIRLVRNGARAGIAGNTNRGIALATGDYVAFLDHDDEFAPGAFLEVATALQERRYGLLYSDEDRIERDVLGRTHHHTPFFKPDFDLDLLRSMNYICHLVVIRRDLLSASGGVRSDFDGAQDHDLLLRVTEGLDEADIRHIPRILYHWRVTPGSVSRTPEKAAAIQGHIVALVQQHLDRMQQAARVEAHGDPWGVPRVFATRVRWGLPADPPRVSVIVPTRDRLDLLRPCIESILRTASGYPEKLEVLIVDNDSAEPATQRYLAQIPQEAGVRVLQYPGAFNWSAINNFAARAASGSVLVFLNNDTVVLTPDWCRELVANVLRPDVGAVGARLLYADGTIQHAGVVLGVEGVAGHECVGESPERGGYFGRSHLQRCTAAVTGACLATRRELFTQVGGFDAVHLSVAFNDIDYCLRVRKAGYRIVYDPFVVLYHFESKSRGYDLDAVQVARLRAETLVFRERWRAIVDCDPYYNSHFERFARPFDRLRAPR